MTVSSAREFGLEVVRVSGGEELVLCPFHTDTNPSAWFNPRTELFYCAVCGFGLNAHQLAQRVGIEREPDDDYEAEPEDYDMMVEAVRFDLGEELYHPYFAKRGIVASTIHHYGVRWKQTPPAAAVLPLTNLRGEVKGVCYRYSAPEGPARYKVQGETQPVWPMKFLSRMPSGQPTLVTEGAWSAMLLHQFLPHITCLALLGAKANQGIVDVLQGFDPIFLYDGDMAGYRACARMRELWPTQRSYVVTTSPDDMDAVQLGTLIDRLMEKVGL